MASDGTLRIDSSINTTGFSEGLQRVTAVSGGVLRGIAQRIGDTANKLLFHLKSIIKAISGTIIVLFALMAFQLGRTLSDALSETSVFHDKLAELQGAFADLKGAMLALFANLLAAAMPMLMQVIDWLTKAVNLVSMIVAAFLGQTTVMRAVAGTMSSAAKSAKKDTVGALAAFDQINVLAKKQADEAGPTGGGTLQFETVPIEKNVLESVARVKKWFKDAWDAVVGFAVGAWTTISTTWGVVSEWFRVHVAEPVAAWFATAWETIRTQFIDPLAARFSELVDTLVKSGRRIYEEVIAPLIAQLVGFFIQYILPLLVGALTTLGALFSTSFAGFKAAVGDAFVAIRDYLLAMMDAWEGVIKYLTGVFTGDWKLAWEGVVQVFSGVINGLKAILKGVANILVDVFNALLRNVATGVNSLILTLNTLRIAIPDWVPYIGGSSWSPNIPAVAQPKQIPRLATGAVIPPNAAFTAVLGDQRAGRNLEAPEGLIRQILREELEGLHLQGDFNFSFGGSLGALVRELKPHIDREDVRVGTTLVAGKVTR